MVKINLRDYYPDYYTEDNYIMVTEDIAEAFEESRRKANAERVKQFRHKSYVSLDCNDNLEVRLSDNVLPSPLVELERNYLSKKLYEALSTLSPEQQRRINAKFFLGLSYTSIAKSENCDESSVRKNKNFLVTPARKCPKNVTVSERTFFLPLFTLLLFVSTLCHKAGAVA